MNDKREKLKKNEKKNIKDKHKYHEIFSFQNKTGKYFVKFAKFYCMRIWSKLMNSNFLFSSRTKFAFEVPSSLPRHCTVVGDFKLLKFVEFIELTVSLFTCISYILCNQLWLDTFFTSTKILMSKNSDVIRSV